MCCFSVLASKQFSWQNGQILFGLLLSMSRQITSGLSRDLFAAIAAPSLALSSAVWVPRCFRSLSEIADSIFFKLIMIYVAPHFLFSFNIRVGAQIQVVYCRSAFVSKMKN